MRSDALVALVLYVVMAKRGLSAFVRDVACNETAVTVEYQPYLYLCSGISSKTTQIRSSRTLTSCVSSQPPDAEVMSLTAGFTPSTSTASIIITIVSSSSDSIATLPGSSTTVAGSSTTAGESSGPTTSSSDTTSTVGASSTSITTLPDFTTTVAWSSTKNGGSSASTIAGPSTSITSLPDTTSTSTTSLPNITTTVTTNSTASSSPLTTVITSSTSSQCINPTCPTGILRAQYPNTFDGFNTTYYKQTPSQNQTTVTSFSDIGTAPGNFISYEYAAFLYSCQGGTYAFTIGYADDLAFAWFGSLACGDFQKANNQTSGAFQATPGTGQTFVTQLAPNQYLPIRLIYVNAAGPAVLNFTITGPDGTVGDSNFYPVPCVSSNGFVPFGSEAVLGKGCANP